jgi:hypothetical protein
MTNLRATRDKHRSQDRYPVPLPNALISSSRYFASDRRDSIYGILGQDIEADYTISLCTVHCIAICALEKDCETLDNVEEPLAPVNWSGHECDGYCCASVSALIEAVDHCLSTR